MCVTTASQNLLLLFLPGKVFFVKLLLRAQVFKDLLRAALANFFTLSVQERQSRFIPLAVSTRRHVWGFEHLLRGNAALLQPLLFLQALSFECGSLLGRFGLHEGTLLFSGFYQVSRRYELDKGFAIYN